MICVNVTVGWNLCGSSLIQPSSIVVHVVRVGVALAWSIRVGLRSILVIGVGLRSILGIGVDLWSSLSIEAVLWSSLSIEAALGSRLSIWVHVILVIVEPLQWKNNFLMRELQNQPCISSVFSSLTLLNIWIFYTDNREINILYVYPELSRWHSSKLP